MENLFGSATVNPSAETIRINRQNYEVIGVLKSKGRTARNQDDVVMMPLRTAQLKLGGAAPPRWAASPAGALAEEMDLAQAQVTAILRRCTACRPARQ